MDQQPRGQGSERRAQSQEGKRRAKWICTPEARDRIVEQFPDMKVLTTELHPVTPNHFGQKYFGTDYVD